MSTVKRNTFSDRFSVLARLNEVVFHIDDMANLWKIKDRNTLHTTLKRYTQKGLLFRIYRGFYSIKPPNQIDSLFLGTKALHQYSYVSTETVLAKAGIIMQNASYMTLISPVSKKFSINNYSYRSRKLSDRFLFNNTGINIINNVLTASTERATADILYFNPKFYFDAPKLINWKIVRKIQKEIGYPLTQKNYDLA